MIGCFLGVAMAISTTGHTAFLVKNARDISHGVKQHGLDEIKILANIADFDKVIHEKIGFNTTSETDDPLTDVPNEFFDLDKDEGPSYDLKEPDASKPDADD
jgi:hypothetical protein